jgi:hypothetical protein
MQELGLENAWVSELIFTSLFVAFVLWTFSPFVFARKRFYTSLLYSQVLSTLVGEATFSTSLPAQHPSPRQRQTSPVVAEQWRNMQGAHALATNSVLLSLKAAERI